MACLVLNNALDVRTCNTGVRNITIAVTRETVITATTNIDSSVFSDSPTLSSILADGITNSQTVDEELYDTIISYDSSLATSFTQTTIGDFKSIWTSPDIYPTSAPQLFGSTNIEGNSGVSYFDPFGYNQQRINPNS